MTPKQEQKLERLTNASYALSARERAALRHLLALRTVENRATIGEAFEDVRDALRSLSQAFVETNVRMAKLGKLIRGEQ